MKCKTAKCKHVINFNACVPEMPEFCNKHLKILYISVMFASWWEHFYLKYRKTQIKFFFYSQAFIDKLGFESLLGWGVFSVLCEAVSACLSLQMHRYINLFVFSHFVSWTWRGPDQTCPLKTLLFCGRRWARWQKPPQQLSKSATLKDSHPLDLLNCVLFQPQTSMC